jgi:hypothetical protein
MAEIWRLSAMNSHDEIIFSLQIVISNFTSFVTRVKQQNTRVCIFLFYFLLGGQAKQRLLKKMAQQSLFISLILLLLLLRW